MPSVLRTSYHHTGDEEEEADDYREISDVHAVSPPLQPSPGSGARRDEQFETSRQLSSEIAEENFTNMSRQISVAGVAGSMADDVMAGNGDGGYGEANALAIVTDSNLTTAAGEEVALYRVRKEEVESKISAWQAAEVARINNRFKREDVIINGWESEHVEKASSWLKKVQRKLDEQRARAMEKMQNEVAKARRKAEEKRASAEARRGAEVARVAEVAKMMRAVGRAPSRRSFF